jgi:hypothetical protein
MCPPDRGHRLETAAAAVTRWRGTTVMTHDLLTQLAEQRQSRLRDRAEWDQRTAPTRPAAATTRRTGARRSLAGLGRRRSRA